MKISKGKISTHQAFIFIFLAIASPLLRLLPNYTKFSQQATWLVPIISLIFLVPYILILNTLLKNNPDKSLSEIFDDIFGKIFGKIVTVIFLLWAVLMLSLYLRHFAERYLSTIMRDAYIEFLLIVILMLTYTVVVNNIEYLARMFEILAVLIAALIIATTLITFPEIKLNNLLPITTYDAIPVLKSSFFYTSLISFMIWPFFFVNEISHKENFKKSSFKFIVFISLMGVLVLVSTIGSLGVSVTRNFQMPFFILSKNISLLDSIERIEAIYISIWTITDLAIISLFTKVIISILKNMFKLKTTKSVLLPIILIEYVLAMYLARNAFELYDFSDIAGGINFCVCVGLPLVAVVVGKIRKVI